MVRVPPVPVPASITGIIDHVLFAVAGRITSLVWLAVTASAGNPLAVTDKVAPGTPDDGLVGEARVTTVEGGSAPRAAIVRPPLSVAVEVPACRVTPRTPIVAAGSIRRRPTAFVGLMTVTYPN